MQAVVPGYGPTTAQPGLTDKPFADVEEYGVDRLIGEIAEALRAGTYRRMDGLKGGWGNTAGLRRVRP